MEGRRLLTIPEAAEEIGMSRVVLWRHVKKGTLPSMGTDRVRLIDAEDLARFAAAKRKPGWPKGKPRKVIEYQQKDCRLIAESRTPYPTPPAGQP